jgi:hypothetical protein
MTIATVKARDKNLFAQGLILKDLAKTKEGDHDTAKFAAIWRPGSGEQQWASGMDLDEFKAKDAGFFKKGLRLTVMDIENGSFAGVWRSGSGAQWWHFGLDYDKFKAKDAEFFEKGLRLEQIDYEFGEFAGLWRPGSGGQRWASGMDLDEFKSKEAEFRKKGLRLVDVSITGGFDREIVAVWRPGTGEQRWASRSTDKKQQLDDLDKDFVAQGLRMEIVAVHR